VVAKSPVLVQVETKLRKRLSSLPSDEDSLAGVLSVQAAPAKRWVPKPFEESNVDWRFLSDLLHELHGSPRHGNPKDPVDSLIYVMLSRKTPIRTAGKMFGRLKRRFPTWEKMLGADVAIIRRAIRGGGLEATRAKDLQKVLTILREEFGKVSLHRLRKWSNPRCLNFLTRLPGVGVKSALCVLMYAFDRKVFPGMLTASGF
jgi:endonuclease III